MSTKVKTNDIENIVTSIWDPWTHENIPTEKALRDAIGGGWSVIEEITTLKAWEDINTWEYVALWPKTIEQSVEADTIETYWPSGWSTSINFWQTIELTEETTLWSLIAKLDFRRWRISGTGNVSYSVLSKIYNISWSYWTTSIPTWSELYTSDSNTWSYSFWGWDPLTGTNSFWIEYFAFNFGNVVLPAWQYAFSIEWSISVWGNWLWELRVFWSNSDIYGWNYYEWWVPYASKDMRFILDSTHTFARKLDVSDVNNYWFNRLVKSFWVALENKLEGENINIKNNGNIPDSWIIDWTGYFWTNTPWVISDIPWDQVSYVWIWNKDGILYIWWKKLNAISISRNTVYYTSSNIMISWYWTISSWAFVNYGRYVEISTDWKNFTRHYSQIDPQSTWLYTWAYQLYIPAWHFFRIVFSISNASLTSENHEVMAIYN